MKNISWAGTVLLRHGSSYEAQQVYVAPDGTMSIEELLSFKMMRCLQATADDIEEMIVESNRGTDEVREFLGELPERVAQYLDGPKEAAEVLPTVRERLERQLQNVLPVVVRAAITHDPIREAHAEVYLGAVRRGRRRVDLVPLPEDAEGRAVHRAVEGIV